MENKILTLTDLKEILDSKQFILNKNWEKNVNNCPEAIELIKKYNLNYLDIKYIIKNNLEFKIYKCPFCEEQLHVKDMTTVFRKVCSKHRKEYAKYLQSLVSPEEREKRLNKAKENNLKKFGCEYSFQSKEVQEKIKKTNLERYGVENPSCNEQVKLKTAENNIRKYGVKSTAQLEEVKAKARKTNLERYGVEHIFQSNEIKQKIQETNLKKYGVNWACQNEEIKQKIIKSNIQNNGNACSLLNLEIKEKAEATLRQKYGDNWKKEFGKLSSRTRLDESYLNLLTNETFTVRILTKREDFKGLNTYTSYKWKCEECGTEFEYPLRRDHTPPICRKCHPKIFGKIQNEIYEYIKEIIPSENILINIRSVIAPLELDIYIPNLKVAIEFNGDYWHSENAGKDKNYHLHKTILCEEKGIHLIHIFEHEWELKKDKIKSRLKNLINKSQEKIFARKCEVKEINYSTSEQFLQYNHLQGNIVSSINLGLFYKGNIVAVMTFGKPRFSDEYEYELLRFATSTPVVGGASKLLKYFEKKYNPKSLISYANRCWSSSQNNVYLKLGFEYKGSSDPNYIYIKNDIQLSRYQCQKHKLAKLLGASNFDSSLSESENMKNNGYIKVYDCGNLVYKKNYRQPK